MTEQSQPQGYDAWDIAAVGSTILGIVAIILAVTLPARDLGLAIAAAAAGLILAIATGAASRSHHRPISWFSRIGSGASVVAVALLVLGELVRNQ